MGISVLSSPSIAIIAGASRRLGLIFHQGISNEIG